MSKGTHALRIVQNGLKKVHTTQTATYDSFGYLVEVCVGGEWLEPVEYFAAHTMDEAVSHFIQKRIGLKVAFPLVVHIHAHPEPYMEAFGQGYTVRVWRWSGRHARAIRLSRLVRGRDEGGLVA